MNPKIKIHFLTALFFSFVLFCGCKKEEGTGSASTQGAGESANHLLSGSPYSRLAIEIDYMPGFYPEATSISNLQDFLNAHISKPGGIAVSAKEISAGAQSLSLSAIQAIEKNNRTVYSSGTTMGAYILVTNGEYSGGANVLGVAYYNTSFAIFGKTIHDNSGGIGQTSRVKLESTVMEHEFGHLLGLVNLGSPMQQNHIANGNHCSDSNCLMYYASETTDILGILITGNIPILDSQCSADLTANGGK